MHRRGREVCPARGQTRCDARPRQWKAVREFRDFAQRIKVIPRSSAAGRPSCAVRRISGRPDPGCARQAIRSSASGASPIGARTICEPPWSSAGTRSPRPGRESIGRHDKSWTAVSWHSPHRRRWSPVSRASSFLELVQPVDLVVRAGSPSRRGTSCSRRCGEQSTFPFTARGPPAVLGQGPRWRAASGHAHAARSRNLAFDLDEACTATVRPW